MARKKNRPIAEMNVVPYIDVMFVLLVIFMITAPIMTQGVKVDLPKLASEPLQSNKNDEPLIVTIKQDGQYIIERGKAQDKAENLEFVSQYVLKIFKQNNNIDVLVRGDQNVMYGKVIELMSTLQAAGASSVGLVTEAPEPKK